MSDIIFNDACLLYSSMNNADEAQNAFEDFVAELAAAIDDGLVESVIRSQGSILDGEIALTDGSKWSVFSWFDGDSIDPDARLLILTLDNKVPVEADYPLSEEDEQALMTYDYFAGDNSGPKCFAFGFALHTGSIVASVPTHQLWEKSSLEGHILLDGKIERYGVVCHFSRPDHISEIRKSLDDELFKSISGRAEFIAQKAYLFKNLKFSPDIDGQAVELTARQITNLLAKLQKMDQTAESWKKSGNTKPEYQFAWRGESTSTMGDSNFRKARKFNLPEGGTAIFENHLDFSASHRIHFIEDGKNKTFIVGYVGSHLPTVLYPH